MFNTQRIVRVACAMAAALLLGSPALAAERLRVGGTGATNALVTSLGPLFAAESGITLELIRSLGTGGGNRAVADGVIDLSMSGRALNAEEAARGLVIVAELKTPFGLVTSHPAPNGFKSAEVAQIYQSDKPAWADGRPIRIVLRPTNESDTGVLADLFPGMGAAIAKVRARPDLSVAATDQDNAEMAEKLAGSLVGFTFVQLQTEKRNLRFVAIDGVEPSLQNYEKGVYPFGKKLYLVIGAKQSPAVARFVAFLRSPKGVAALREAGVLLSPA